MPWPTPYFQPNPKQDCQFYATAYLCRCFGFAEVTAQDVMAFRHTPREIGGEPGRFLSEAHFPEMMFGLEIYPFWLDMTPEHNYGDRWWLGPSQRPWVEQMLADGWLGRIEVMRVREMAHACVLLESRGDAGALIFDPYAGLVVESWEWLLGPGPRHKDTDGWADSHRIEAWYRRATVATERSPTPQPQQSAE